MSFRGRRALGLRPVHSEKHEITWSNLSQNASTVQTIPIVTAVAGEPSTPAEVQTGATVKGVYFETNLNGVDNSGVPQVFHWGVIKVPSLASFGQDPAIYDANYKRWYFKRGMEMLPEVPLDSGGTVQTKRIFFVRLPPKFRRFGEGDKLSLIYKSTSTSGISYCGFAIYKEFT